VKHSVWGFTLLEVVVALAVVSLALGGALSIASSSARSARHLERTITAHWVARNVIATLRLAEPDARAIPGTFEETMRLPFRGLHAYRTNPRRTHGSVGLGVERGR